jgi:hypothetical protein
VIAGVVAATLTLLAAIIGLITVLVNDDGGSDSSAPASAVVTDTTESGGGGESTSQGSDEEGEGPLDPGRDGNSRASAKRLPPNRMIYSSIIAGNDEDWYVYEAPKDETATVEVATTGEDPSRLLFVELSEGLDQIESSSDATEAFPFVVPWTVTAGTRLFLRVADICEELGGCSVGAYKVVVRTKSPG